MAKQKNSGAAKKPAAKTAAPKGRGKRTSFWGWVKRIVVAVLVLQLVYIVALKWVYPPITLTQLGSVFAGDGLKRDYVAGEKIAAGMKLAVMASEDQVFPVHGGFDWKSIDRAMKHNEKAPRRVRGASTISQQTAKNVFLWQGRSWVRKALEVYFTKMIEWVWGKKRILEVYVNVIEMGKGIYGAEAAAQAYFGKPAARLTRREAALIAAALPNPKKYTVKPLSRYVSKRSGWVLRQMAYLDRNKEVQGLVQ